jgi:long-chain acyl-CoA synthetase
MNLYQSFAAVAKRVPDNTAVIDGETRLSYGELLQRIEGMAAYLAASSKVEAIGIYLPTSAGFVISFYGAMRAGFAAVPLNLLVPAEALNFICQHAELDLILTSEKLKDRLEGVTCRMVYLEDLVKMRQRKGLLQNLKRKIAAGMLARRPLRSDQDLAVLLYTSGTTGEPKGVRLTHHNVLSNIEASVQAFGVMPSDVMLGILPLFHTFALTATMGIPLHVGATFVTQVRFIPSEALEAIERHKVTLLPAVPTMHRVMAAMQKKSPRKVDSLRLGVAGGEPLPPRIEREFTEAFGVPLVQGYGLTETSPVLTVNPPAANRSGSAGKAIPGVELRIVGEDGAQLPTGEVGEIIARGPNIMQGYHKRPDETAKMIKDGWLYTGDMGYLDDEGYLFITGRRKEMIIVGGMNVFPAEIEAYLAEHPGVELCAVIGQASESHGELVKAVVVPKDETVLGNKEALGKLESELREFLRDKLAPYKLPKQWEFRPEVPVGPTGKVLKKAL